MRLTSVSGALLPVSFVRESHARGRLALPSCERCAIVVAAAQPAGISKVGRIDNCR